MKKNETLVARRRSQYVRAFTLEVLFCWEYRLLHVGWLKNATLDGTVQFLNYNRVFHYIRMDSNGYVSHTEELQQSVSYRQIDCVQDGALSLTHFEVPHEEFKLQLNCGPLVHWLTLTTVLHVFADWPECPSSGSEGWSPTNSGRSFETGGSCWCSYKKGKYSTAYCFSW